MIINNHLLDSKQIPSPHHSGRMSDPTILVLHYTASGEGNDAKFFQNPNAKVSAHLVIERDGTVTQCVPFNIKAWHAGVSVWKGRSGCNSFSIGIEIDNWGLLTKRADGKFYSHRDEEIPASRVVHAKNKLGNGAYWEAYPAAQLDAVQSAVKEILKAYPTITQIVGHEDISPRRKIDPGPALYAFIEKLNNEISGGRNCDAIISKKMKVIANSLNIRAEPSTSAPIVGSLKYGDEVTVIYDGGRWSKIKSTKGDAWVDDSYLK